MLRTISSLLILNEILISYNINSDPPLQKKKSIEALLNNKSQALAKKKKIDSEVTEEDSTVTEREILGASLFHAYTSNLPQLRNDCKG